MSIQAKIDEAVKTGETVILGDAPLQLPPGEKLHGRSGIIAEQDGKIVFIPFGKSITLNSPEPYTSKWIAPHESKSSLIRLELVEDENGEPHLREKKPISEEDIIELKETFKDWKFNGKPVFE